MPRIEPGAAGCEARTLSIVLCGFESSWSLVLLLLWDCNVAWEKLHSPSPYIGYSLYWNIKLRPKCPSKYKCAYKVFLIDLFDWGASATCNFNRDFVSEKCCQRWDLRTFWLNIVCHRVSASLWLLNVSLITHLKLMVTNLSEILACCIHWQHFPKELELTESVNALYEYCLAHKLQQRSHHKCSQFLKI